MSLVPGGVHLRATPVGTRIHIPGETSVTATSWTDLAVAKISPTNSSRAILITHIGFWLYKRTNGSGHNYTRLYIGGSSLTEFEELAYNDSIATSYTRYEFNLEPILAFAPGEDAIIKLQAYLSGTSEVFVKDPVVVVVGFEV